MIIHYCDKCKIEAIYDKELWGYVCPKCKIEGCLTG